MAGRGGRVRVAGPRQHRLVVARDARARAGGLASYRKSSDLEYIINQRYDITPVYCLFKVTVVPNTIFCSKITHRRLERAREAGRKPATEFECNQLGWQTLFNKQKLVRPPAIQWLERCWLKHCDAVTEGWCRAHSTHPLTANSPLAAIFFFSLRMHVNHGFDSRFHFYLTNDSFSA